MSDKPMDEKIRPTFEKLVRQFGSPPLMVTLTYSDDGDFGWYAFTNCEGAEVLAEQIKICLMSCQDAILQQSAKVLEERRRIFPGAN